MLEVTHNSAEGTLVLGVTGPPSPTLAAVFKRHNVRYYPGRDINGIPTSVYAEADHARLDRLVKDLNNAGFAAVKGKVVDDLTPARVQEQRREEKAAAAARRSPHPDGRRLPGPDIELHLNQAMEAYAQAVQKIDSFGSEFRRVSPVPLVAFDDVVRRLGLGARIRKTAPRPDGTVVTDAGRTVTAVQPSGVQLKADKFSDGNWMFPDPSRLKVTGPDTFVMTTPKGSDLSYEIVEEAFALDDQQQARFEVQIGRAHV